jgi:hypothetical protein
MKRTLTLGLVAGSMLMASASWAMSVSGSNPTVLTSDGSSRTIVFGVFDSKLQVCEDGILTQLEADTTLSDHYKIEAGAGNDTIRILRNADETFDCDDDTMTGAFTTNSKYIDVDGDTGDDNIAGGPAEGRLYGEADEDRVTVRGNHAGAVGSLADGGPSTDTVCSDLLASTDVERLYGQAGNDCLERGGANTSNTADGVVVDCGDGSDIEVVTDPGVTDTACETHSSSPCSSPFACYY